MYRVSENGSIVVHRALVFCKDGRVTLLAGGIFGGGIQRKQRQQAKQQ